MTFRNFKRGFIVGIKSTALASIIFAAIGMGGFLLVIGNTLGKIIGAFLLTAGIFVIKPIYREIMKMFEDMFDTIWKEVTGA